MAVECPSCRYQNRDDAIVCNLCKTVLRKKEELPAASIPPVAPARAVEVAAPEPEERVDVALVEMARMIFAPMPATPHEGLRAVIVPLNGAHYPERCPGCAGRTNAQLELTSPPFQQRGAAKSVEVPFCRSCVELIARRKRNLAIRAAVMFVLFSIALRIHAVLATVAAIDLLRIAWLAASRGWWFGAKIPLGDRSRPDEVTLAIADRAYAEELRRLNPPKPKPVPEISAPIKPKPAAAVETIVGTPEPSAGAAVAVMPAHNELDLEAAPDTPAPDTPDTSRHNELELAPDLEEAETADDPDKTPPPPAVIIRGTPSKPEPPAAASRDLDAKSNARVKALLADGDAMMKEHRYVQALVKYEEALEVLPPPAEQWPAVTRIFAALGEAYFQLGEWKDTKRCMTAALTTPQGAGDPNLLLRLGEALLELGEPAAAKETLTSAYLAGGAEVFARENAKYRPVLQAIAQRK